MEINVLSANNPDGAFPDAGALDDFEGLGLNDASPDYGDNEAEDSDARSPSLDGVLGSGGLGVGEEEDAKLREEIGAALSLSPMNAGAPFGDVVPGTSGLCDGGVVDIKAPIDEQEAVGFPDPIEIEVNI